MIVSICMEWDAPHKNQNCERSNRKVISCSHCSRPQWRVCTFGCVVCTRHRQKGNAETRCIFIYFFEVWGGVVAHTHTHTTRHDIEFVSFSILDEQWETLRLYLVLLLNSLYLVSFIFENCDKNGLPNDSDFLSLFHFYFIVAFAFAIVNAILKVILVEGIELVDFACWVRKHLHFDEEAFVHFSSRFFFLYSHTTIVWVTSARNPIFSAFWFWFLVIWTQ